MDWTRADIISALALVVSAISGWVSWKAYQRTAAAQHPHFSFELEPFDKAEWWGLTCFIDNRSLVGLEPTDVFTSRFGPERLSLYEGAYGAAEHLYFDQSIGAAGLARHLVLGDLAYPIAPQSKGQFTIIFKSPPKRIRLVVRCTTIEAKPRTKKFSLYVKVPQSP